MTAKEEYESILKSGMFFEFFPQLNGNWKDDEIEFTDFVKKRNTH